jgi:hypothetical protein
MDPLWAGPYLVMDSAGSGDPGCRGDPDPCPGDTMIRSRLCGPALLACALVGVAACERRAEPASEATPAAAEPDVAVADPPTGERPLPDTTPGPVTAADHRLTRSDVERFAEASKQLRLLAERDPGPMRRLRAREGAARSASLEETVARLDAEPAVREAIESAGLTTREYALITVTLSEAILVQQALAHGSIDRPPPGVSQENLDFVRTHRDEISRLLAEVVRDP